MFKFFLVIVFIFLNSSLLAREFDVFPGLGLYKNIDNSYSYSTINNIYFYNPSLNKQKKLINDNRILLRIISLEMDYRNQLNKTDLDNIDADRQKLFDILEKFDLAKKIVAAGTGVLTLDPLAIKRSIWEGLKPLLMQEDFSHKQILLDILEQSINGLIDILIDYGKVDTFFINEALSKTMGDVFMVYDAAVSASKITNSLVGIIQVSSIQREQAKDALVFNFLLDYILKYKSNINDMKQEVIDKKFTPSKDMNNFWSIWWHYSYYYNRDAQKQFTLKEQYELALKTSEYIEKYSSQNLFNISLAQYIDEDNYQKMYVTKVRSINRLYYIPKNIDTSIDGILQIGFFSGKYQNISDFKINVYFKAPSINQIIAESQSVTDGVKDKVYVRLIDNASIEFKVINTYNEVVESRTIPVTAFYIPSYFDDIPENYQFMPSIAKMFNQGYINGYQDTLFKPKENASIGQFLAMVSNALLDRQEEFFKVSNVDDITFSKYSEYLNNTLKIDIDYSKINDYKNGSLDKPVTRKYVAKVIANILNISNQFHDCGIADINGWDKCSNYLKTHIGIQGSMKLDAGNNPLTDEKGNILHEFKPDAYITRDELTAMIIAAKEGK